MHLNADFSQRAVVRPGDHEWVPSPMPGVTRLMLDRIGDEVARATSLVRYAPNSTFPAHEHGGGEEILVLKGAFADEHGRYPAGSYLRNPIGTRHAPRVDEAGAEILVKLHQFEPSDERHFARSTTTGGWLPGSREGLSVMPLHRHGSERVSLLSWGSGLELEPRPLPGGAELFVLEGAFEDDLGVYGAGSWLRLPPGHWLTVRAGADGARIYFKSGHLSRMLS
ncbi:MAG: cupin domain-containing protein [Pseudomonadota bacterium]